MKSSALARASVSISLVLAVCFTATSEPTFAAKGGKNGGASNEVNYDVAVVDHPTNVWSAETGPAGPYAPSTQDLTGAWHCLGDTPGNNANYAVKMLDTGDDDPCGNVELYDPDPVVGYKLNGYTLEDAVGFTVVKVKEKGSSYIYSVILHGQEKTGPDSSWHDSREMVLDSGPIEVPTDPTQPFTLHVHKTVPVEIYDSHLNTGGNKPLGIVGWISVGDLVYTPQQ